MMKVVTIAVWTLIAVSAGWGQPVKLDGLFMSMRGIGGNYTPTYYWFMSDGRFFEAAPVGGLTPADFKANCQGQPMMCGTFQQSGVKVTLTRDGKTRTITLNAAQGGYQIDGSATLKAEALPATTKLDGDYSGSGPGPAVSTQSGAQVSSAHAYSFKPNGTYTTGSIGSVRTSGASAVASSGGAGTYQINGNTIELTMNGKTTRHLFFIPYSGAVNIDGVICRKAR